VAFNLGNSVREYYATYNDYLIRSYFPQTGTTFTRIQYSSGYSRLYAGTNTSYIHIYSCSSGTYTSYSAYVSNPPIAFSPMSNGFIAELSDSTESYNYIYKTNSSASYCFLGTLLFNSGSINASSTMVVCPDTNLIVTAQKYYSDMAVYDQNGFNQQYLQYMTGTVKSLDCSSKYIVAVDSDGYISINTYAGSINIDGFPGWVIGLIVGFVVLIIAVGAIIKCAKAKRARAAMGINNYNQIDNQIPAPQPYFSNNQGYNPNAVNPAGQGYSPNGAINPGYNPNGAFAGQNVSPGYDPYPTQTTNPYATNQPRNWS